jgi:hypothetical protein
MGSDNLMSLMDVQDCEVHIKLIEGVIDQLFVDVATKGACQ